MRKIIDFGSSILGKISKCTACLTTDRIHVLSGLQCTQRESWLIQHDEAGTGIEREMFSTLNDAKHRAIFYHTNIFTIIVIDKDYKMVLTLTPLMLVKHKCIVSTSFCFTKNAQQMLVIFIIIFLIFFPVTESQENKSRGSLYNTQIKHSRSVVQCRAFQTTPSFEESI